MLHGTDEPFPGASRDGKWVEVRFPPAASNGHEYRFNRNIVQLQPQLAKMHPPFLCNLDANHDAVC
jgi:hypothetical protein